MPNIDLDQEGTVRVSKPAGIKAAFGLLGLNLAAAAGSLGIRALEKKVGPSVPAAQVEFTRFTEPPAFVERSAAFETFKTPLIVAGVGVLVVLGVYVVSRVIRKS